jgi:hypothetical protein
MNDLRDAREPAAAPAAHAGYCAQLLRDARIAPQGLLHRAGEVERRLAWDEIWFAVAAEVGEPEGVRAIVFDLVVGRDEHGFLALRLDAEPGPFAEEVARAIQAFVPRSRCGPSIKSLAHDGVPSQWYPDLESFEEAAAAAVARSRA